MFKIVNQTVPEALERLGYSAGERKVILDYIDANDTIEGAPGIADEHLPVFDCAFRAKNGTRTIHYLGHIKMMAAVQPFLSGAISKTVNMPHDATPDDIAEAYRRRGARASRRSPFIGTARKRRSRFRPARPASRRTRVKQ
jgi:ribonucleoside-diphosphate reductase alpha chain